MDDKDKEFIAKCFKTVIFLIHDNGFYRDCLKEINRKNGYKDKKKRKILMIIHLGNEMKLKLFLYCVMSLIIITPQVTIFASSYPVEAHVYASLMFILGMVTGVEVVAWINDEVKRYDKEK